jgi:hypothetical protein
LFLQDSNSTYLQEIELVEEEFEEMKYEEEILEEKNSFEE